MNENKDDQLTVYRKMNLGEAKKLYRSENEADKKLALFFFPEDELKLSIAKIIGITRGNPEKIASSYVLEHLAEYYNKGWKKTCDNTGYFLSKDFLFKKSEKYKSKGVSIYKHDKVCYAGITYFQNEEDLKEVIDLMDEEQLNNLFG